MIPATQRGNNAVMIKPKKRVNNEMKRDNRLKGKIDFIMSFTLSNILKNIADMLVIKTRNRD